MNLERMGVVGRGAAASAASTIGPHQRWRELRRQPPKACARRPPPPPPLGPRSMLAVALLLLCAPAQGFLPQGGLLVGRGRAAGVTWSRAPLSVRATIQPPPPQKQRGGASPTVLLDLTQTSATGSNPLPSTGGGEGTTVQQVEEVEHGRVDVKEVASWMPVELLAQTDEAEGGLEVEAAEEQTTMEYAFHRLLMLLVAVLWGSNFGCIKLVDQAGVLPSVAASVRFAMGALALSPFLGRLPKEMVSKGIECGLWVALGYISQAIGLETVSASKSAFLCSLTVVVVPLVNWISGKGKPSTITSIAAALAVMGTGLLELGDVAPPSVGDAFSLLQAVGFGVAFTRIEGSMKDAPGMALPLAAVQLATVAAVSAGWTALSSFGPDLAFSAPNISFLWEQPQVLGALAYTGLITTALAIYWESVALEKMPASEMAVILSLEPLAAALFAYLLLGETFGAVAWGGGGLILAACLTAEAPLLLRMAKQMGTPSISGGEGSVSKTQ
jgi:drug/metabolite transporter (DMT)-like permease